jgi:hypothetical protein
MFLLQIISTLVYFKQRPVGYAWDEIIRNINHRLGVGITLKLGQRITIMLGQRITFKLGQRMLGKRWSVVSFRFWPNLVLTTFYQRIL